jgi:GNAT superfamily N-acetyltransferase
VDVRFRPVTPDRLGDLARFSERHGKFRYCSCMRWRLASTAYRAATKEERVASLAALARGGTPIGVLAYADGHPVGWCSIAPRETYVALGRYKALPPIDAAPVWSVVCFFVDSRVRRRGLTRGLLRAAVAYAVACGANIVEGYPVDPRARLYTYMGSPATFRAAGFRDVTPAGRDRPVFRYHAPRRQSGRGRSRAQPLGAAWRSFFDLPDQS